VRNIIGQEKSSFDFRQIMDEGKIMIINLSKGRVGEANANLLGSMLITKIYLAAMSRADKNEAELNKLPNFYLYVDEFQSFANESFADILSEARKYKLNLTIAHQYIEQMSEEVRAAVFGNVGTMITFRVGAYDAETLEKEFAPIFTAEDLVNLGFAQVYLKLMIDGVSSTPFSARTLPPIEKPDKAWVEDIIKNSRQVFAKPRAAVEEIIAAWHEKDKSDVKVHPQKDRVAKGEDEGQFKPPFRGNPKESRPSSPQTLDPRTFTPRAKPEYKKEPKPQVQRELPEDESGDFKPLKALSLKQMKDQSNNQRQPAPERMSDLRNALKAVVGDKVEPKKPMPSVDVTPKKADPVSSQAPRESSGPKEIPEDELKKLLDAR
jgi:hypothetical protein